MFTHSKMFACFIGMATGFIILYSDCQKNSALDTAITDSIIQTTITNANNSSSSAVPAIYKKIYGATSVSVDGSFIVITTKDLPDHKSPYYKGTQWESTLYEAYNGSNKTFGLAPNTISAQNLTFRIPSAPKVASSKSTTPMGPIGIALNGVPFFNQYAAGGAALGAEINGFDQYGGHPQMQGQYHYHVEPTYLTAKSGKDALMGFLLDGFPVYGPQENGKTLSDSDLDKYHGHTAVTTDYPNGIYHYHFTTEAPYLNGDGFWGTAGTVSK